jgi:hypothetical protein
MQRQRREKRAAAKTTLKNTSDAIKKMVRLFNSREAPHFHVALLKYYIDTVPYPAHALTVMKETTPNLRETPCGFECDAYFPPRTLNPEESEGKEVVNGVVKVNLFVDSQDVLGIFSVENGRGTRI